MKRAALLVPFVLFAACSPKGGAAGGSADSTATVASESTATVRDSATHFPAVAHLRALAADVRAILGPTTQIVYGADWSEYRGHQPQDGSGDVFFHLDPLWADANIAAIGVDWYPPLTDWRDGETHLDRALGRGDQRSFHE